MVKALLALLALAQVRSDGGPVEEIVVIGRRFEQASVAVGRDDRGRFTCAMAVPSGNARLDDRLCRAAAYCVGKGAVAAAEVRACIERKKPGMFAKFRREWARERR